MAPSIASYIDGVNEVCDQRRAGLPSYTDDDIARLQRVISDFKIAMEIEWEMRKVTGTTFVA